jgi:hypothetical protein
MFLQLRFLNEDPQAITVFLRKEDDWIWRMALVFCHPNDNYSRKEGRIRARRRYFQMKQWGFTDLPTPPLTVRNDEIVVDVPKLKGLIENVRESGEFLPSLLTHG